MIECQAAVFLLRSKYCLLMYFHVHFEEFALGLGTESESFRVCVVGTTMCVCVVCV